MTKKSIYLPFFITSLLLPYIGILIGFLFYQDDLQIITPILIITVITAVFSCFAVDNALYHMLISLNQIAAFIITLSRLSGNTDRVPAINTVVDPMSFRISALIVIVGVLFIIGVFIIAYLYKKLLKMLLNYDERISESERENAGTKPSLKVISVISFVIIILSVLFVIATLLFFLKFWFVFPGISSQSYSKLMVQFFVSATVLFVTGMVISHIVSSKDGAHVVIALNARSFGYVFLFTAISSICLLFILVFILSGPVMFIA